ncbi:F-box/LRR-repeat protein 12-like [Diadema antillarum]|uniref:F-box/LRR-repeat protein 12-like n=1 Tax=Diadema antillarum TaxID=105358 RepID=UPI003A8B3CF7
MPKSKGSRQKLESTKGTDSTKTPCNTAANSLDVNSSLDYGTLVVERDVLTPKKLADHISSACQPDGDAPVKRMPDSIMLQIFGYLCIKTLCRAACVCRGWNHLVRQKPLWRHVDLSPYKITLPNIRKLVFAYFTDSVRSLSLTGFLQSVKNTECISDALLIELGKRCLNLSELCISSANLSEVDSSKLPTTLSTLKLFRCNYPMYWLSAAFKKSVLGALQHLDMSHSNGFGCRDLEVILEKPLTSLVTLRLTGCYRVADRGVGCIVSSCPNLEELGLARTSLSNEALQKISTGLPKLRTLDLDGTVSKDGVMFDVLHLSSMRNLEELFLIGLDKYSGGVLVGLVNVLPKLKLLTASKDVVTEADVQKMKNVCVMPSEEAQTAWKLNFYPQDKLKKLAALQSAT